MSDVDGVRRSGKGLTAADAAELDVLLWELCGCWDEHRRTCTHERPCPFLVEGIAAVIAWRDARLLRTRAEGAPAADQLLLAGVDLLTATAVAV